MYGCDCRIGCLTGAITRIGKELEGVITQIGSGGIPSLGLSGSIFRVGSGFNGYVSIVCSTNRDAYLSVSTDVLWLTPDMLGEEFDIYSNVNWKIDAKDVDNGGDEPTILSMLDNSTYLYNEYYLKNSI